MAMSASTCSVASSAASMKSYEVFISHRGLEMKMGLANHLHHALKIGGIKSFLDVEELPPGEDVRRHMLEAARTSVIGVPIFTEMYGSSEWCLDELVGMIDNQHSRGGKVIPVFYNVQPEDLRMKRDGPFAGHFEDFVKKLRHPDEERIQRWKSALQAASWLAGYRLNDYGGRQGELVDALVEKIVNEVVNRLPVERLPTAVGLDAKVQDVMQRFRLHESTSVYVVLIWGMGGIGKSTLARAVYDTHRETFQKSSFVDNCVLKKALQIQDRLRKDLLLDNHIEIGDLGRGRARLKHGLSSKKVLIVLDDLNRSDGINSDFGCVEEIIDPTSLSPGSLILLTSRDLRLFPHRNQLSDVFRGETYELQKMDFQQSRQLFYHHAFKRPFADPDFEELATEVVEACDGLPLSLEVLGRLLSGMGEKKQWKEANDKLRSNKYREISGRLRISYEALDEEEQLMFQDVACFFIGVHEWRAEHFWDGLVEGYKQGLQKLKQLCLVKIDERGCFTMHDHLRDLGRDESRRGKTWVLNDQELKQMLDNEQGLDQIRGIVTSLPRVHATQLAKMRSLQLLQLKGTHFNATCKRLQSLKIRWLSLTDVTSVSLPKDLPLEFLTVLHINVQHKQKVYWYLGKHKRRLWYGKSTCMSQLKRIRQLHINGCTDMKQLHVDFCFLQSLESLRASELRSITKLPSSFGQLKRLRLLNIAGCNQLKELPEDFGCLESLEELWATGLTSITKLPSSFGQLKRLRLLGIECCYQLKELPEDFGCLESLEELWARGLTSITKLPSSFGQLKRLRLLDIAGCKLKELPEDFGCLESLEELWATGLRSITKLPSSFGQLKRLRLLDIAGCNQLKELPEDFGCLESLEKLWARGLTSITKLPSSFGQLKRLRLLDIACCNQLKELPEDFGCLESLEELWARGLTSITKLPSSFGQLKRLNLDV